MFIDLLLSYYPYLFFSSLSSLARLSISSLLLSVFSEWEEKRRRGGNERNGEEKGETEMIEKQPKTGNKNWPALRCSFLTSDSLLLALCPLLPLVFIHLLGDIMLNTEVMTLC